MRIRPILNISTTIAAVCGTMVLATIVTLLMLDARGNTQATILDNIVRQLSVLRSLQPDFSGPPSRRAIQQWQIAYAQLTPFLRDIATWDNKSEMFKTHVLDEHAALAILFSHLVSADQTPVGADTRAFIGGELSVRTAAIISDILSIRGLTAARSARATDWLTGAVAASLAALGGVVLVLMRILRNRVALPIAQLQRLATELSSGDLDRPVRVRGNDDVSALADSFDSMRQALKRQLDELSQASARLADANANLEQRVQERTQQLETAVTQIRGLDEAKSQFFANISHELRTPLTLILGPIDELLASGDLSGQGASHLVIMRRNALTLLGHVNDLLDFSRSDANEGRLDYSRTDLAKLVQYVTGHFEAASSQRGIKLRLNIPNSLITEIDAAKCARILFNLVSNAFKHASEQDGVVQVALRTMDDHAIIEIGDNGPGIPVTLRESIFERFFQANDSRRNAGSGLGLAISKQFVTQHGGSIVADEVADGTGALFRIALPITAPQGTAVAMQTRFIDVAPLPVPEPVTNESVDPAPDPALPLVLVVEDNADLRNFIVMTLRPIARVAVAADGVDGLTAASRLQPDLILTDIMMPRMSGDEMVARLRCRADHLTIPVMVLSARADEPLRIRLLRGQAQDYLVKPFAADELKARVLNLLQTKRARDILQAEVRSQDVDLASLAGEVAALNRRLRVATDEMRLARDQAEQGSRVKSAFLNMVSHELRTPLTALQLQLQLLQRLLDTSLNDRQAEILGRALIALQRLSRLVGSVLDYSRIESGRLTVRPEDVDLNALIAEACADADPEAKRRGLAVSYQRDCTLPALRSDPALIRIVLSNLLDNAVKYTPSGSISVAVTVAADRQRIAVADTGPGIAEQFQTKIFQPFEQLEDIDRKHSPGIGLGLALAKQITEALGGRIWLTSCIGEGSFFYVELPSME